MEGFLPEGLALGNRAPDRRGLTLVLCAALQMAQLTQPALWHPLPSLKQLSTHPTHHETLGGACDPPAHSQG